MSTTIRCVTTTKDDCVEYEIFINGERKWIETVFFRNDRRHRAGGPAFQEAARRQEKKAQQFIAENS